MLRLFGLTDSSSKLHRALLAETPAPFSLPAPDMDTAIGSTTAPPPSTPVDADPSQQRGVELAQLHEVLAVERLARVEADKRRAAADAELIAQFPADAAPHQPGPCCPHRARPAPARAAGEV